MSPSTACSQKLSTQVCGLQRKSHRLFGSPLQLQCNIGMNYRQESSAARNRNAQHSLLLNGHCLGKLLNPNTECQLVFSLKMKHLKPARRFSFQPFLAAGFFKIFLATPLAFAFRRCLWLTSDKVQLLDVPPKLWVYNHGMVPVFKPTPCAPPPIAGVHLNMFELF